jgi:hypothetical protein
MKRIYLLIVLLIVVAGGIGYAAGSEWGDRDWRHDDEKVQVVNANGQDTIVVRDHDRGFFPGFLFIPLFIVLIFGLSRLFFWRGRGGPWNGGPDRFEEWHRRAHAQDTKNTGDPNAPPAF